MITTVTTRDIIRNYKKVFKHIQETHQPAVFYSHKQAQVAIVSLDDFKKLQEMRHRNSARAALNLIKEVRELLKDEQLPTDLSTHHDDYLWEER